jgi:hypothetical protein
MTRSTLFLAAVALVALSTAPGLCADPALLASKAFGAQTLDGDAVKAVLLGKQSSLAGTRIVIVIARDGTDQDKFLQSFLGMNTSQLLNHWRRLCMTGGGSAPKIVDNEEAAGKLAAETAGAVAMGDSTKADGLIVLAMAK